MRPTRITLGTLGKQRRFSRIFGSDSGRIVSAAVDDSLLAGPFGEKANVAGKFKEIVDAGPDAILGFPGMFLYNGDKPLRCGLILNLTASSTRGQHTRKVLVGSVEKA